MTEKDTPKPKPSTPKKAVEEVVIYDAVLDDATIEQHAADEAEVVDAADMEIVEEVEAPVVKPAASSKAPASEYAVVSGKDKDEVRLSAIIFENKNAKKSLSVHHLQRRLREWGFDGGYVDRDGWYGESTRDAVHAFQEEHKLPVGELTMNTLLAIFEGDSNVKVLP